MTCAADSTTPSGPADGDLDGTYPNPVIEPNAVTGGKVADGSLGLDDLDDVSNSQIISIFPFASRFASIAAQTCEWDVQSTSDPEIEAGDLIVPQSFGNLSEGSIVLPYVAAHDGDRVLGICNSTDASITHTNSQRGFTWRRFR